MYKISTDIDSELISRYEDYFCEIEIFNWSIEQMVDNPEDVVLCGYFDTEIEARKAYGDLREVFEELSANYEVEEVFEEDFQNAYKQYLSAFSYKDLHWVPIWLKEEYTENKEGDKVFYFDAQMAFGTGDHPTTRLCMMRILDYAEKNGLEGKSLADAGCGSGILAMTAMLYGVGKLRAFDIDEAAIKVCLENASFNNLDVDGIFKTANIEEGLGGDKYDLVVANIQSDILMIHSKYLLEAVGENGVLILSGILKEENEKVREFFLKESKRAIKSVDFREMGDWSDIIIEF